MPPHAARSSATSPEAPCTSVQPLFPSGRMANSMDTLPRFNRGARADSGMMAYQFMRTACSTRDRYGPKSTPWVSLRTSRLPCTRASSASACAIVATAANCSAKAYSGSGASHGDALAAWLICWPGRHHAAKIDGRCFGDALLRHGQPRILQHRLTISRHLLLLALLRRGCCWPPPLRCGRRHLRLLSGDPALACRPAVPRGAAPPASSCRAADGGSRRSGSCRKGSLVSGGGLGGAFCRSGGRSR